MMIIIGMRSFSPPPTATFSITDSPDDVRNGVTKTKKMSYRKRQNSNVTAIFIVGSLSVSIAKSMRKMPRMFWIVHAQWEWRPRYHVVANIVPNTKRIRSERVAAMPSLGILSSGIVDLDVNRPRINMIAATDPIQ